jgi:hypothetical protein
VSAPESATHGTRHAPRQLLVVVDPLARRSDGESVRIAKDVLSAGAAVKICLPDTPEEFARALARRGHRRPVVVGDDRTLLRTVALLHRERELGAEALSLVPVDTGGGLALARALGVPGGAVAAARTVLDGRARTLDLLVDDSDGVVVGHLRIPGSGRAQGPAGAEGPEAPPLSVWHVCRSLARTLIPAHGARHRVREGEGGVAPALHRLLVEADGVVLADLGSLVEHVEVRSRGGGTAEVVVRMPGASQPLCTRALSVTVSGADFHYDADALRTGPVRTRTWTLRPDAWSLTLPEPGAGAPPPSKEPLV